MIPFFPKQITRLLTVTYLIVLILVSVIFMDYSMKIGYMVLGICFVCGFGFLTQIWSNDWKDSDSGQYKRLLFVAAVVLRLVWVVGSYFYYISVTGVPFEIDAADAIGYHNEAEWLASEPWSTAWRYYFGEGTEGVSDVGYPLYLTALYKITGPVIIIPRIIKAILSAWTCLLIYRLAGRTFGEQVGRMAGIMCVLMPNLIIYCGYHLKETEMIFLTVAFLERTDLLLRSRWFQFWNILLPTLLAGSLFFFRTFLGMAAMLALFCGVLLSTAPTMKRGGRRTAIIVWAVLCLLASSGSVVMNEIEENWGQREKNVVKKRQAQENAGIRWAKYATGTVMAPMAVALPFSTMIDVDNQVAQQTKHGGNFIRNFMAFFALLGIFESFRQRKWRDFSLIGAYVVAYLAAVSMSGFSNSERFLLPALPGLIMMWAYGISQLRDKTYRLLTPWCVTVVLMEIGWAFFKLGSRSLL
jgi:invasion protein IalB